MPRGYQKSRSLRRTQTKTPGGTNVQHYTKRNHKVSKCATCKNPLLGVPRKSTLKNELPKTKRIPSRPYGGILCSKCSRAAIKGE